MLVCKDFDWKTGREGASQRLEDPGRAQGRGERERERERERDVVAISLLPNPRGAEVSIPRIGGPTVEAFLGSYSWLSSLSWSTSSMTVLTSAHLNLWFSPYLQVSRRGGRRTKVSHGPGGKLLKEGIFEVRFNFEYSPFRTRDEGVLVVHLVLSVSELVLERHRACVILEEPRELGNTRAARLVS